MQAPAFRGQAMRKLSQRSTILHTCSMAMWGIGAGISWQRLDKRGLVSTSNHLRAKKAPLGEDGAGEDTNLLPDIACPVLLKELDLQRERCSSSTPESEHLFEQWCRKSGGVSALETCFRVHPFPVGYFENLDRFQDRVLGPAGMKVSRKILLSTAFMHKSWLSAGKAKTNNLLLSADADRAKKAGVHSGLFARSAILCRANEGLELLGDSVIKCAATEMLLHQRPFDTLDQLNQHRSMLENNQILGIASLNFWISAPLLLFDDDALHASRERIGIGGIAISRAYLGDATNRAIIGQAANALEAVLGAVTLEHGHSKAIAFAQAHLIPSLETLAGQEDFKRGTWGGDFNPVSKLIRRMHASRGADIVFRRMPSDAAAKRRGAEALVKVGCFVMGAGGSETEQQLLGVGYGSSMSEARRDAALRILPRVEEQQGQ